MGKKICICVFILGVISMLLTGCGANTENAEITPNVRTSMITYKNTDENKWMKIEVPIHSLSRESTIREIYTLLQEGIAESKVMPTVPKDVVLKDVYFDEGNIKLNLSEEYHKMEASEEIICRTSIAASILELSFVDSVSFLVSDVSLKAPDGTPLEPYTEDKLVLDENSEEKQKRTKKVLLYFANEEDVRLVPYEDEIEINPDEPLEKTVLKLLIAGPKEESLAPTVPEGTKIISISINEGICYVDLSREFVSKHPGGSAGEIMTIYSIVNTLTELPDISKVQFLIEGEKQEMFKGHEQFDGLFERNLDLVNH